MTSAHSEISQWNRIRRRTTDCDEIIAQIVLIDDIRFRIFVGEFEYIAVGGARTGLQWLLHGELVDRVVVQRDVELGLGSRIVRLGAWLECSGGSWN